MNNRLVAEERKEFRRSVLTKLRKEGKIPAVVYGKHENSKAIVVKNQDFLKLIRDHGRNGIISLEIGGKPRNVVLEDFQWNPISHDVLHLDFLHVDMSSEIHAKVYVELTGNAKGVEHGGVLQQSLHEINVTAKPNEIPEAIEVDISDLEIGHTINIGAIRNKYHNITIKHEDDEVIATIIDSGFVQDDSSNDEQSSAASDAGQKTLVTQGA
ncbi:50S ribosomal protein L25/general stress protein Ctc [Neobacillus sp. OS1-32]|uniref:50S ribosomal protein L25/general stress protein Ctc n=1 Tax=Neobacillus sp. OS1-32 TaxID=3070682 RepID=UPI0027DFCA06|nr:50S ribosomal protein L25/general stress protein Ctc [Neobacillus sp. OS1-32]WML28628.1 50S ribosomal protein L25/general stress protein Ctc [Neobacillus sp. OS1-32]